MPGTGAYDRVHHPVHVLGREHAGQLVDEIDGLAVKTYPQLYGSGMPMSGGAAAFSVSDFALESVRTFGHGVCVRTYSRNR